RAPIRRVLRVQAHRVARQARRALRARLRRCSGRGRGAVGAPRRVFAPWTSRRRAAPGRALAHGLVGGVHWPPLPGSPRAGRDAMRAAVERSGADAKALASAGFDAIVVENFGDAPFYKDVVPPVTIAAMTACVLAAREEAPRIPIGVNV